MALNPILLYSILTVFTSCNGQTQKPVDSKSEMNTSLTVGDRVPDIGKNIRYIFQDSKNNYWFGSNDEGVYYYDGKTLIQYTGKHGLCNNQIRTIQEDKSGNIYFGTGDGVCFFDGHKFTTLNSEESNSPMHAINNKWKLSDDDLWFDAGYKGGVYRYDGKTLTYLQFPETNQGNEYQSKTPTNSISPYTVYCILKDSKGHIWFGTQNLGVCRYDGKSFTWFTEKGLRGPAVRAVFEDGNRNIWFGNNGSGLIRYDGKSLTNFTEEKGLSNEVIEKTKIVSDQLGTLARVWTINEDKSGSLWIGTIDAGVWKYDGKILTNYTSKDGLANNAINTIYNDKKGELWFGTSGKGVYKFNGKVFERFRPSTKSQLYKLLRFLGENK